MEDLYINYVDTNDIDAIIKTIEHCDDINIDNIGSILLKHACENSNVNIVELLLNSGADHLIEYHGKYCYQFIHLLNNDSKQLLEMFIAKAVPFDALTNKIIYNYFSIAFATCSHIIYDHLISNGYTCKPALLQTFNIEIMPWHLNTPEQYDFAVLKGIDINSHASTTLLRMCEWSEEMYDYFISSKQKFEPNIIDLYNVLYGCSFAFKNENLNNFNIMLDNLFERTDNNECIDILLYEYVEKPIDLYWVKYLFTKYNKFDKKLLITHLNKVKPSADIYNIFKEYFTNDYELFIESNDITITPLTNEVLKQIPVEYITQKLISEFNIIITEHSSINICYITNIYKLASYVPNIQDIIPNLYDILVYIDNAILRTNCINMLSNIHKNWFSNKLFDDIISKKLIYTFQQLLDVYYDINMKYNDIPLYHYIIQLQVNCVNIYNLIIKEIDLLTYMINDTPAISFISEYMIDNMDTLDIKYLEYIIKSDCARAYNKLHLESKIPDTNKLIDYLLKYDAIKCFSLGYIHVRIYDCVIKKSTKILTHIFTIGTLDEGSKKYKYNIINLVKYYYGENSNLYRIVINRLNPLKMFNGFITDDIHALNLVLDDITNTCVCPFCFQTVYRSSGCNFVTHSCSLPINSKLYKMFVNRDNNIIMCVSCNKLTKDYLHYSDVDDFSTIPKLEQGEGHSCKNTQLKLTKCQRLVELMYKFLPLIGKIPYADVYNVLTTEFLTAYLNPISDDIFTKIKNEKHFIITMDDFPVKYKEISKQIRYDTKVFSAPTSKFEIIPHLNTSDAISMEECNVCYQFNHNDVIHVDELVGIETIKHYIKIQNNQHGLADFGKCWSCSGTLHPAELRRVAELHTFADIDDFKDNIDIYEKHYEQKYGF